MTLQRRLPGEVASHGRTGRKRRRGWLVRRALLAADLAALLAAFALTQLLFRGDTGLVASVGWQAELAIFVATLPGWVVLAKLYGLYDADTLHADHSTADDLSHLFHMVTVAVWGFFATSWLTGLTNPSQAKLATFWLATIVALAGARACARLAARRSTAYTQNVIVVGAGDVGQLMGRKLLTHPEYGLNLVGFVDSAPREQRADLHDMRLLGGTAELAELVRRHDVERVVIAFSNATHAELIELIRSLRDLDVQVDIVPRLFEIVGPRMVINSLEGVSIVSIPPFHLSRSSRLLKRTTDVVVSSLALTLAAPLLAVAAVAIKLDSRGPVFFGQLRMGAGNRTFRMLKLRTMVADAESQKDELRHLNKHALHGDPRLFKIEDDPRITRVGRVLRRYSLDEVPQLLNVLRGEMSLVGPRPLVLDEDEHVAPWARGRLDLRPGMTGLWQVVGRTEMPFDEMVKLDYLYVTGWSLGGDLKLMLRTVPSVLRTRSVH